jgi:hypothetical protein
MRVNGHAGVTRISGRSRIPYRPVAAPARPPVLTFAMPCKTCGGMFLAIDPAQRF